MKKYILVINGNCNNPPTRQFILDAMADVTSSVYLKYREIGDSLMIHFGSDMNYKFIEEHVKVLLDTLSPVYLLMEHNDNLSVKLKTDTETEQFLSLDDTKNSEMDKNTSNDIGNLIYDFFTSLEPNQKFFEPQSFFNEEDYDDLIKKSEKTVMNLDEILDKIHEKGLSSLNKSELNYLNSLSK